MLVLTENIEPVVLRLGGEIGTVQCEVDEGVGRSADCPVATLEKKGFFQIIRSKDMSFSLVGGFALAGF